MRPTLVIFTTALLISTSLTTEPLIPAIYTKGHLFTTTVPAENFDEFLSHKVYFDVQGKTLELYPYKEMTPAKDQEIYSNHNFDLKVQTGEMSYMTHVFTSSKKVDDNFEFRVVVGYASGMTERVYSEEKYQECKRFLAIKRCQWKIRKIPRGFSTEEAKKVKAALEDSVFEVMKKYDQGGVEEVYE